MLELNGPGTEPGNDSISIGFQVGSLEQTRQELLERKLPIIGERHLGKLAFFFTKDPAGVTVQFAEQA